MIVIGVDPGSILTGWGVVSRSGARLHGLAAGAIQAGKEPDLPGRLRVIYEELMGVIERHRPEAMAVEDIFFAHSAAAALKLGHARGVALLAGANSGLPVFAYPPALVKRSVAGRGQASKQQVARMIGAILGWKELPTLDATDALAVAITHLNAAAYGKNAAAISAPGLRARRRPTKRNPGACRRSRAFG